MKTRLPRQALLDAMASIASLTGGRTTKPILACVKLTTTNEDVELTATDGEASLRMNVPALSMEKTGEVVVSAERLLGIVREMPDVEITLEADDRHCHIAGESSQFKIFVQNAADFPPVPTFGEDVDLTVDGAQLWRMIGMTLYAAARETSRYAINGILWEKRGDKLFLIATDGRRLARAGGKVKQAEAEDFQAIVPAKAMGVFEKVFSKPRDNDDWLIDIRVMPNQMLFRRGSTMLATALVEGRFPKYEDVIPSEHKRRAKIERAELHAAIRRAALLTTDDARAVRLGFDKGKLIMQSQSPDQGEARVEMPIDFDDEPVAIGFNPNFLADALKVLPYEVVFFELQEDFNPGVICAEDKNEFLYVIMPVSLTA